MTRNEDLNRLFEAALEGRKAPSRFGAPKEQRKFSPIPVQPDESVPIQENQFQAVPVPVSGELEPPPPQAFPPAPDPPSAKEIKYQSVPAPVPSSYQRPPTPFEKPASIPRSESSFPKPPQATPIPQVAQPQPQPAATVAQPLPRSAFIAEATLSQAEPTVDLVTLGERSQASPETGLSEELGIIMDEKSARAKRQRRRSLVVTVLILLALIGGATRWVVNNPERFQAMKGVLAEIKSVGDIKGMVAEYQKALDKIALRGQQLDAASSSMGVDPTSVDEHAGGGFDKEMREITGEDGGPTAASRNTKLQEKFKDNQESETLNMESDAAKEE